MTLSPKLKGYATLLVVFLLGGVVGAGITHVRSQHRFLHGGDHESSEHRRLDAISRRLDLDGAEQQKVADILDKYSADRTRMTREMLDTCGTALRTQKEQMDAEIRAVLRPDQQTAFDALLKEQHDRLMGGRHH
ncbi:MAG TPA: hypothetical protein VGM29_07470 [Polyangiaceae bacterium]|jgi:hypothetical protein